MVDGVPAMMGVFHMLLQQGIWDLQRAHNMLDGGAPIIAAMKRPTARPSP
ncbi:hypothetical protein ACFSZS_29495 [Seohaeicola zhoushanensis]